MDAKERNFAAATLDRLIAAVRENKADDLNALFLENPVRDLLFGQLEAQREAALENIMAAMMPAHSYGEACRVQAQETPIYKAWLHKETDLQRGDTKAARIAIDLLKAALES